jgi:hypothetical protein
VFVESIEGGSPNKEEGVKRGWEGDIGGTLGEFVHGYGSVRNFPTMHTVMYEEIACCVFEQDYDLILVSFRGPSGIRLGKVSVVDSGDARRAELEGLVDKERYRGRRD